MLTKQRKTMFYFLLSGILLVLPATQAYARDHEDRPHKRNSSQYSHKRHYNYPVGRIELALSNGFFSIFLGTSRYYVSDGIFYAKDRRGYTVIAPPTGALVREIPSYFRLVVINGITYYTNDEYYYQYTPHGYVVVPQPAPLPVVTIQDIPIQKIQQQDSDTSFTVNIPNNNDNYTPVIIKRYGSGFVGPQGEFYPEFPKIEQLKIMYVK